VKCHCWPLKYNQRRDPHVHSRSRFVLVHLFSFHSLIDASMCGEQVAVTKRVYLFNADSAADYERWMAAFSLLRP
jgi:hypothetical protein